MLTCPVKLWASARRTGRLQANTSAGTFDRRLVQRRNPQLFLPVSQQASTTMNMYANQYRRPSWRPLKPWTGSPAGF